MTPRTMEEVLFETIQSQKAALPEIYDLSAHSNLFDLDHPQVLRAKLGFKEGLPPQKFQHSHWKAAFYSSEIEASKNHQGIKTFLKGNPANIFDLMNGKYQDLILDFSPLGWAALSLNDLEQGATQGEHLHLLPPWVTYAMSPELWSASGKWTRFHERLHTLFEKFDLLQGDDRPGFYPLKPSTQILESHGFKGSLLEGSFQLMPNWTFPLSALKILEEVVSKEC